jgi:radical SAM superfamily enzyme YgiQ (UPF0313 family)
MILPALTEAKSPYFRPIKYSLFPPLGLATLAGYLDEEDRIVLQDEHVEELDLDDEPDLVVIQVYITSASRAYRLADHYRRKGAWVCLGGLHVTSLPEEAALHADTIFCGPGEDTWPRFLADFRAGRPGKVYRSTVRTLDGLPPIRRDLIRRHLYLVPNSIVVSRGCPHVCDFCYKEAFFEGGRGFYTQTVDDALAEIERLPGRHLYFLDDHLFGNPRFAGALFDGMRGMGRLWQAAGTVQSVLRPGLLERAVACGLRSLFVGFETLDPQNLLAQRKHQNLRPDYGAAVRRLHDLGVMVNGSFVFGMDEDGPSVFDRTVDWAVGQGIETATFHILTPYPGTALFRRMEADGRILHRDWDLYDTRHAVFRTRRMTGRELEAGYRRAYETFYRWPSILRGARTKPTWRGALRHAAYAGGWKKFERLWDWVIRARRVSRTLPILESVLSEFGRHPGDAGESARGRQASCFGFPMRSRGFRGNRSLLSPDPSLSSSETDPRPMTQRASSLGAGVAALLFSAGAASGAPPVSIHRASAASQVADAPAMAVVAQAPFDDAPGLLSDGLLHFYVARDASGQPLAISLLKNVPLDTVRVAFDDENALAAPVDEFLSTVTVAPDTIPADGFTMAVVTIVPRDAAGVPLGSGLDVRLDPSALWPGGLVGLAADLGNGAYRARILSSTPGQGEVWVTVEGAPLASEPTVVYDGVGGPLSLRELVIVQLEALTATGGAFEQLVEGLDPNADPGAYKVAAAHEKALEALNLLEDGDLDQDKSALDNHLKSAIGNLVAARQDPGAVDARAISNLIEDLLDLARKVALFHRNEAAGACGPCSSDSRVCQADEALQHGDDEWGSPHPDYEKVVDWYAKTVDKALDARNHCSN